MPWLLWLALSVLLCADVTSALPKSHLTLLEAARRCDPWAASVALKENEEPLAEYVNMRDRGHRQTALTIATKKSSTNEGRVSAFTKRCEAVVELLLDTPGIEVDATDAAGNTALWWSQRVGNAAVSRRLREHGAHMRFGEKTQVEEKSLRRL